MLKQMLHYADFALNVARARLFSEKKPLEVCLKVTNRCNLRCPYCYGAYFDRESRDFTKEELLSLIDELHQMGTRVVDLSGGEPLLRDDISEVIDRVKTNGMFCFMNTNGILLPEKIAAVRKLDAVTISLDGDAKTNDTNRGEGTFKKIAEAVRTAKKEKLLVSTNTVINRNNLGSIDGIVSLAEEWGVTAGFNLPYARPPHSMEDPLISLKDEEIREVLQKLVAHKKSGAPIAFSLASREYTLNWPWSYGKKIIYGDLPAGFKAIDCYMGRFMCLVDSNGLVYPCGQLIDNFPALNIHEVGFKKAWDNLLQKRTCKTCYSMCFNEINQVFGLSPGVFFSNGLRFLNNMIRRQ